MRRGGFFLSPLCLWMGGVLILAGCNGSQDGTLPITPEELSTPLSELTPQELEFYHKLNRHQKKIFLEFSPEQRAEALFFATQQTRDVAMDVAVDQDVLRWTQEEQAIYKQLDAPRQLLFFSFDDNLTDWVVQKIRQGTPPIQATVQGADKELKEQPEEDQELIGRLTPDTRLLFLALTTEARRRSLSFALKMEANSAVERGAQIDLNRLPLEQRRFSKHLSIQQKALFLLMSPQSRGLAIALTTPMDPNIAVYYTQTLIPPPKT